MYIFHFGRHPKLSLKEVQTRYPEIHISLDGNLGITKDSLKNPQDIQKNLGGTIMISHLISTFPTSYAKDMIPILFEYIQKNIDIEHKIKIGISSNTRKYTNFGFDLKKLLKENNISCRIVTSKKVTLNTGHILKEKLLTKGLHIWILEKDGNILLSHTVSVQDIDAYGLRDYEKPFRDARTGMLPPKLAQIMINLSYPAQKILDPFCGTGTVILEGMNMGKETDGSDINPKLIEGCKKNVEWYKQYISSSYNPHIFVHDAKRINSIQRKYDAIVTEGYLGPTYIQYPDTNTQRKNFKDLEELYTKFLSSAEQILNRNGKIIITFPAYHKKGIYNSFFKTFEKHLKNTGFTLDSQPLIYGRDDQVVWREIIILRY